MSITTTEILSQPDIWRRAGADPTVPRTILGEPGQSTLYLGCGTSEFVAEAIAILREQNGFGVSDAGYASEWTPARHYDRVVVISRSGTTSEVLDALRAVPAGTATAGVTAVADSPLAGLVDELAVLGYADEESVVQTRFPTTVLAAVRGALGTDLDALADELEASLRSSDRPDPADFDHFVYLGTGWTYGLAQEAALKIREAAQAWSESYPALDYRHGPIAVAHDTSLVWLFGDADPALAGDIEATGATVRHLAADPLVQLVQAQRLAVGLAESRGLDPDVPRHLTRSVILD